MSSWGPIDTDPPRSSIERIVLVPFLPDGACALISHDDRSELPSGVLRADEDVRLGGALRILLETAGFRTQGLHAFARPGTDVAFWSDGDVYRGSRPHATVDLDVAEPRELAARLEVSG